MKRNYHGRPGHPAPVKGKPGLAEAVEKRIRHYIRARRLRDGDALPKEKEFAQMFNVTRNVVREACSRLRMLGVVESKKRRGMILTCPDIFAGLERVAELDILDEKSERDLFEFRLVLELGLADLIFARKTAADIRFLRAIVTNERDMGDDLILENKLDAAFHRRLFQITENQPINRLHNIIASFFSILQKRGLQLLRDETAPSHEVLLNVLEHGTAKRFREAMRRHLKFYFKHGLEIVAKPARDAYPSLARDSGRPGSAGQPAEGGDLKKLKDKSLRSPPWRGTRSGGWVRRRQKKTFASSSV